MAKKPRFIGSNSYLFKLKRNLPTKKAGFSGTLDPFACGTLVIAYGEYTKLFRFLKKSPKVYRATLWLGASSPTLDIDGLERITETSPIDQEKLQKVLEKFTGEVTYTPPAFCAKRVNGKRAYELARRGEEVVLQEQTGHVFEMTLLNYTHPFVHFEASVSEGMYIRSLGELIARELGVDGALSYLERVREGSFVYEENRLLNPVPHLQLQPNHFLGEEKTILHGGKIDRDMLQYQEYGDYYLTIANRLSIISVTDQGVKYQVNGVSLC